MKPGEYRLELPEQYVPVGYSEPVTVDRLAQDFFFGKQRGVWAAYEVVSSGPPAKRGGRSSQKEVLFNRFDKYLEEACDQFKPMHLPGGIAFNGRGNPDYVDELTDVVLKINPWAMEPGFTEQVRLLLEEESAPARAEITPHICGKEEQRLSTMLDMVDDLDNPAHTFFNALYNRTVLAECPLPVQQQHAKLNGGIGNLLEYGVLRPLEEAAAQANEEHGERVATVIPRAWLWEKRNGFDPEEITMKDDGYQRVGDLDVSLIATRDVYRDVLEQASPQLEVDKLDSSPGLDASRLQKTSS